MLWYKAWLETRWRFLIGLAVMLILAVGSVMDYRAVATLMPVAQQLETKGLLGRIVSEAMVVESTYRGFVWWEWFKQNLPQSWTLLAVLLGSGGLLANAYGDSALFTLSLPVSRNRLLLTRAGVALGELLVLAFAPSLVIPLISSAVGQSYDAGDALVHAGCVFVGGTVFFALALLLSTVFQDIWRPMLIAGGLYVVMSLCEQAFGDAVPYGIFHAMSAESYFRAGTLPWIGLLLSTGASVALFYGAASNLARHDF